jgi:hypothetical protein
MGYFKFLDRNAFMSFVATEISCAKMVDVEIRPRKSVVRSFFIVKID